MGFYRDFSQAIVETGILSDLDYVAEVPNLALKLMDPGLGIDTGDSAKGGSGGRTEGVTLSHSVDRSDRGRGS